MLKRIITISLFLVTLILVLSASIYYNNLSIIIFWLLFLFLGLRFLPKGLLGQVTMDLVSIFIIPFCAYTIFTIVTAYALVKNPINDYFLASDSLLYWKNLGNVHTLKDVIDQYNINLQPHWGNISKYRLFNLISLLLSYGSNIVGQNHIIVQTFQGCFLGALSIPYIFQMIKKYTDAAFAYRASLLFALLCFVFTFSCVYTRDIHIFFLYTLSGYFVINFEKMKYGMIKLVIFCIITFFIRFESGIYMTLFLMAYLYLKSKKNKALILIIAAIIPIVTFMAVSVLNTATDTIDYYSSLQQQNTQYAGGGDASLARSFSNLPVGLKQVALAVISQTDPVPFYRYTKPPAGTELMLAKGYTLYRLPQGFSGLFWVIVWSILIYALIWAHFRLKKLPKEALVMFIISILYILITTADINVRRTICVYPFIYLISMYVYFRLPRQKKISSIRFGLFLLALLYGFYFLAK